MAQFELMVELQKIFLQFNDFAFKIHQKSFFIEECNDTVTIYTVPQN